jgi:predicted N-acyltransferase
MNHAPVPHERVDHQHPGPITPHVQPAQRISSTSGAVTATTARCDPDQDVAAASTNDFDVSVVPSITHIDPAEWATIAPDDDPLWTWSVFAAMEAGSLGPDHYDYVVIRTAGRLTAVMPTASYRRLPMADVLGKDGRRTIAWINAICPRLVHIRTLFVGHLLGEGRLLVDDQADESVYEVIVDAIQRLAKRRGCRWTVFKDFKEHDLTRMRRPLSRLGFFDVPALPDTELRLEWSDFPAYVEALPSKPRRNTRSKLRRFERADKITTEVVEDFASLASEMLPLYQQVLNRAESRLDIWTESFLEALALAPGIRCVVVACRHEQVLVGFLLCVFGGRSGVALRVGLDYSVSSEAALYHNLHYRGIALAIEHGCENLSFSQTAYEPKREMGCRLIPLVHAVTHANRVWRAVLRRFLPLAVAQAETSS